MSGHIVPDDAARLEAALERIARAAVRAPEPASTGLPETGMQATTPAAAPHTAEVAARLDALIADVRAVLGTQG